MRTYQVSTDEEEIAGLSFVAYAGKTTLLYLPAVARSDGTRQAVKVDHAELALALEQDARDQSQPARLVGHTPDADFSRLKPRAQRGTAA